MNTGEHLTHPAPGEHCGFAVIYRFRVRPGLEPQFIAAWDQLEELLIAVYRSREATAQDEREYAGVRGTLTALYPSVLELIRPHLRERQQIEGDPVQAVLELAAAREIIGNRPILQLLPDVRETINRCLLAD